MNHEPALAGDRFSRPLHGLLVNYLIVFPAVNCWAIVDRPLTWTRYLERSRAGYRAIMLGARVPARIEHAARTGQ